MRGRVKDRGESQGLIVIIRIAVELLSSNKITARATVLTSARSFDARDFDDDAKNRNSSRT